MSRTKLFPAVLAGLGAVSLAHAEPVPFEIVNQIVSVNRDAGTATFTLTFNQAPDFALSPSLGRQPDAFQYEVDADWNSRTGGPLAFHDIDAVVRGAEIWEGNGIPVRFRDGGDGGPNSGGWGPVKNFVPFTIQSDTLSFTTPLSLIGDTDGHFRYRVFSTENGQIMTDATGAVIPLPPAVLSGGVAIGAVGIMTWIRSRRSSAL